MARKDIEQINAQRSKMRLKGEMDIKRMAEAENLTEIAAAVDMLGTKLQTVGRMRRMPISVQQIGKAKKKQEQLRSTEMKEKVSTKNFC